MPDADPTPSDDTPRKESVEERLRELDEKVDALEETPSAARPSPRMSAAR